MNKKLTAKTQYLNPNLTESVTGFSKAFSISPENDDLLLRKGTIYAVFNITGNSVFDPTLVTKVVEDVLHESYYQSENISPTQSLEKAITDVRDKVLQLSNESISQEEPSNNFSIVAGVLWGNVLYVVQYGKGKSYLMRMGTERPINTVAEGTFSAASGVIKDDDVVILCSDQFGQNYPPERLLTVSISEQELKAEEACVLMKFIVDTSFTQNEAVDFGMENAVKTPAPNKLLSNIMDKVKTIKLPKKHESVRTIENESPRAGHFGTAQSQSIFTDKKREETFSIRLKSPNKLNGAKFKSWMLVPLIFIALIASIYYTLKTRGSSPADTAVEINTNEVLSDNSGNSNEPVQGEKDEEVFYDIKITDGQAVPSSIVVFTDFVVVSDKETGKIYVSDTETPKFEALEASFPGLTSIINIGGKLGVTDKEGYKVYDLAKKELSENYKHEGLGLTSAYTTFVYSIEGSKIMRYSKEKDDTLSGTLWGQNDEFLNARSMSVAYSIYVITQDGKLTQYTSGNKDDLTLKGDFGSLNNPVQVLADIDFDNVYLADKGNKRVVVFDDNGNFVKEYKAQNESRWEDMRGIGVSPDEKTLFVLSGSRVYKAVL